MLNVGMIVGDRYEIVGCVGSGGMADVYKAKDHKLNRFVAVKVLKEEFSADTNFIRKFQREAQAAAGLAHPNVVNVFDVGEYQGINYIVMELVEGITLKEYISKKGRLTVKEATSIAIQVSMGLEAAHNRNIVHRDIKPQNIIISTDGKVKVTDFGIARVASSNTISTNAMGSVHYSSPEQVRGGYSDFKSDIYSLGVTMYEMVTGRVPFDGDTTVAIAIKHLQDEMAPPSQFVPGLPHSLEEIILKCTQKSPDRRYSTLAELINDLKHSLIDPNGNFVTLSPLTNHAQTIMITPEEMKEIQNSAYTAKSRYDEDDEEDDDDEDDEIYEKPSKKRRYKDEEEDDDEDDDDDDRSGINTSLEKAMTIGGLIIGGIIICILIYLVASAAGIVNLGNNNKEEKPKTEQEQAENKEELIVVPEVVNKSKEDAANELKALGLGSKKGGEEASDTVEEGLIARQEPAAGTEVEKNSQVIYYISTGKAEDTENVTIPSGLTGGSASEVQAILQDLGLKVTLEQVKNGEVEVGKVISLNPGEGTSVAKNTEVTVQVSVGEGDTYGTIPYVRGISEADAVSVLEAEAFVPNIEYSEDPNNAVNYGEVYEVSPQSGQRVQKGTIITIKVRTEKPEEPEEKPEEEPEQEPESEQKPEDTQQADAEPAASQWAAAAGQSIKRPTNYQGGEVQLRLVQNGDGDETSGGTVVMQDTPIDFGEDGYSVKGIAGAEGVETGTLYFSEKQEDGSYKVLWKYDDIKFEKVE